MSDCDGEDKMPDETSSPSRSTPTSLTETNSVCVRVVLDGQTLVQEPSLRIKRRWRQSRTVHTSSRQNLAEVILNGTIESYLFKLRILEINPK